MGRPTKYKPEYCKRLVELMKEGFSIQAVAGELGVNQDTVFEWIKKRSDFSEAYKRGKMLQQIWWEKAGRAIALGLKNEKYDSKQANPTIFVWMTKNLLGWTDKQEIEHFGAMKLDHKSSDGSMSPQVVLYLPDNGFAVKDEE